MHTNFKHFAYFDVSLFKSIKVCSKPDFVSENMKFEHSYGWGGVLNNKTSKRHIFRIFITGIQNVISQTSFGWSVGVYIAKITLLISSQQHDEI